MITKFVPYFKYEEGRYSGPKGDIILIDTPEGYPNVLTREYISEPALIFDHKLNRLRIEEGFNSQTRMFKFWGENLGGALREVKVDGIIIKTYDGLQQTLIQLDREDDIPNQLDAMNILNNMLRDENYARNYCAAAREMI